MRSTVVDNYTPVYGTVRTQNSYNNYYAFGSLQPKRYYNINNYRYGFNGQEQDNNIQGDGNDVAFKFREQDTRLGRFISIDPLTAKYPWYSPYQFAGNTPIWAKELEGLEPGFPRNYILNAIGAYGNDDASAKQWTKDVLVPAAKHAAAEIGTDLLFMVPTLEEEGAMLKLEEVAAAADATRVERPIIRAAAETEVKTATEQVTTNVSKGNQLAQQSRAELLKSKESLEGLIKEHKQKLQDFLDDPVGNTSPEKMKELTKDNPNKEELQKRLMGRAKELQRQINRQETDLGKVNDALNKTNGGTTLKGN